MPWSPIYKRIEILDDRDILVSSPRIFPRSVLFYKGSLYGSEFSEAFVLEND